MIILHHKDDGPKALSKNFNADEFVCKCCGYALIAMDLVHALEWIRLKLGIPVKLNRGYSCPKHNAEVGGARLSRHLVGCAADITWAGINLNIQENSLFRKELVTMAEDKLIYGIGWGKSYIHIDTDITRKRLTQWTY